VVTIEAMVAIEEEHKRTTPVMERMVFEPREDGVMVTIVGHVDSTLNTTV
jgi:hypothetical protein